MLWRRKGHECIAQSDPSQVCELLETFEPAIVFIDIQLGATTGDIVAYEIRRSAKSDVSIVGMSVLSKQILPESVDIRAFDEFLDKMDFFEKVDSLIIRMLDRNNKEQIGV